MSAVRDESMEFWFVGPLQVNPPERIGARTRFCGSVPRSDVHRYYRDADVFLFPTFSDGFGLTQLEAQAWKLPVVASRFCGDVVTDGVNGVLLDEVSADAIARVLCCLARDPQQLSEMSRQAVHPDTFGIAPLTTRLQALFGPVLEPLEPGRAEDDQTGFDDTPHEAAQ
jgi:glycosyltransferase involved in cell wall biosynthesis